jgi:prevent-host-death family protein
VARNALGTTDSARPGQTRKTERSLKTVGTFEARTHLSALLEQVKQGEEVIITRRGKAVARLVPMGNVGRDRLKDTVARLKAFRRGRRMGESVKTLLEEGRR